MNLEKHLQSRENTGNTIKVGLIGCGQMGSSLITIINGMKGMDVVVVGVKDTSQATEVFSTLGVNSDRILITNSLPEAIEGLKNGQRIITTDITIVPLISSIDVVVEATGVPEVGAQVALNCINNKKDIVSLNFETDITVGFILQKLAAKAGVIYTLAYGDEPSVCLTLHRFATSLGLEVVCLGKGKNNPINYDITPLMCKDEAAKKQMNPRMLSSFIDGTKTMVEMAALSNATGLIPDKIGMHGPKVDVPDLNKVFVPIKDGGILSQSGCVDYSIGKVAPGVFMIVTTSDPKIKRDLKYFSMGDGPYYTFYRPYHLGGLEVPLTIAEVVIYREDTFVTQHLVSEVVAVAKRNFSVGEFVQGIGSQDVYGQIYQYQEAKTNNSLPIGLIEGAVVTAPVTKGELFTSNNCQVDITTTVYKLRQQQDSSN